MKFRTPEDIPENWDGEPTVNNPKMIYVNCYDCAYDSLVMTYLGKQYTVPSIFSSSIIGQFGDPTWELCERNYYVRVLHPDSYGRRELIYYDRVDWEKLAERYSEEAIFLPTPEEPQSDPHWVYIKRIDQKNGKIDFNGEFEYCYYGEEYKLPNVFLGNLIGRWCHPREIEKIHCKAHTKDPIVDYHCLIDIETELKYTNENLLPTTAV